MWLWIGVFLYVVVASVALIRYLSVSRALRDLKKAIEEKKSYLISTRGGVLGWRSFRDLVNAVNETTTKAKDYANEEVSFLNQIQATLEAIREAVLIVDRRRHIVFANEFASLLFSDGKDLVGQKLETIMRSADIFSVLVEGEEMPVLRRKEVHLQNRGKELWFEVSTSRIRSVGWIEEGALLLVMHDITRLKLLESIRKDFVANVSHELRTPLTIIKGYAETIRDDAPTLSGEASMRFAEKIVKNADRLNLLVEELLTLSRLESKSPQLESDWHDLRDLVHEVVGTYKQRLANETQRIAIDLDDGMDHILFDRFRVQQVLENLFENAFRYAPDFREIRFSAKWKKVAAADVVECSLTDDGPGIPEKDLPHVFERFYRVDKGRSRETGGTGLGLSIMKHIVQLHGGTVDVRSRLGEGTTFSFTLPQKQRSQPEEPSTT